MPIQIKKIKIKFRLGEVSEKGTIAAPEKGGIGFDVK